MRGIILRVVVAVGAVTDIPAVPPDGADHTAEYQDPRSNQAFYGTIAEIFAAQQIVQYVDHQFTSSDTMEVPYG
jgi:hypothetical protein